MKRLSDGCIPLTVTSPPYDNLRDYGGHPFTFEPIADELFRITAEGGVVVWVVQDQVKDGRESGSSLRQRLYFETIGFVTHATLIMQANGFRFPQKTRYPQQFQYAFVFAKGKPRVVNLIQDRPNSNAGGKVKNSVRKKDGKTVTVKRPGKRVRRFGLRGNIWTYEAGYGKTTKDKDAYEHPALMPEAMAEDLIISFSKPGDLVFDPMCGSGTTCKMALLNDRRYMGMEIHKPYWEIAVKRMDLGRKQHRQKLDDFLRGHVPQSEERIASRNGYASKRPFVPYTAKTSLQQGDVREVLGTLADNSFHGILTDPPYALRFMDKEWDRNLPSVEVWQEMLRVCKPGACLLSFGAPRTFHRLMCNIEDAGWEIRDTLMWLFGQGFPKSFDLGKMMANDTWNGYGTALKPAYEPIIMAMKKRDGSFANNAVTWNLAGLNLDGCLVGTSGGTSCVRTTTTSSNTYGNGFSGKHQDALLHKGRFPANVILEDEAAHLLDEQTVGKVGNGHWPVTKTTGYGEFGGGTSDYQGPGRKDLSNDGASRFFYCAKANKRERNAGLDGFPIDRPDRRSEKAMGMYDQKGIRPQHNNHPCVKPLALCRYLSTLILPPDLQSTRRLLVPYCGTGSEMIGAMQAGWDEVLGIELSPEYIARAEARIDWWRTHE